MRIVMKEPSHNVHMRIPESLWKRARDAAEKEYQTFTEFTIAALKNALKKGKIK